MINPKLGYSDKTQELIERMCRNVERSDFTLDKGLAEELIMKTYDLFGLKRPSNVVWFNDISNKKWNEVARSAWSAGSAGSAWSAWSAWSARSAGSAGSARSALDYDFDWFVIEHEYIENPTDAQPNQNDEIYLKYSELLMQAKEAGLGYRVEYEDTLYLVPTPIVKINSRNAFHSSDSPSIKWKGGEELFHLNGVSFPKDLWEKVVNRKLSFKQITEIQDIDQRTQAMMFCDVSDFKKLGTIVDKTQKETLEGKKVTYELLKIPQGMFTIDAYFAIYNCPSTDKLYLSGIDPEIGKKEDIGLAMSWKQSITKEMWSNSIPLVHES